MPGSGFIRCALGLRTWRYAVEPTPDYISKACRRCHIVRVHPAEPVRDHLLQRIGGIQAIEHLLTRTGRLP